MTFGDDLLMTSRAPWFGIASGLIAIVAATSCAFGQADRPTPQDDVCRRVEASLHADARPEAYGRALGEIQSCDAIVGKLLATQWQRPPRDTAALRLLGEVSGRVRDQRIYDAVRRTATDPSRPRGERLAALEALVQFYDPRIGLRYVDPGRADLGGSAYVMVGVGDAPATKKTEQALANNVREEILGLLTQLGRDEPDEHVRKVAAYLAQRLGKL